MKKASFVVGFIVVLLFCFVPAVFAADGFGKYTTGGAGGTTVTVSNATEFKSYVETPDVPYIVQVQGTIDLNSVDGKVGIRSNKTIKGISPGATIIGQLGFKKGSSNIIIERLNITNPDDYGEGDGISVKENINNVFITKCTFYDCLDGCLDITRGSDNVTVSWCKFYYTFNSGHNFVNLIGSSDSHEEDVGKLHITFHHNWWDIRCVERMPSVRFGRVHIYNNYYNCPGNNYCIRSRIQAECLIENNYFNGVKDPYYVYITDPPDGKIKAAGNIFVNCTGQIDDGNDDVFTPPYSYLLDSTLSIPTLVQMGAGANGIDFFPHWLFGLYGDFDRNGIVDMNDLSQFVEYWLLTDDNEIADADYDANGKVNGYEYALFAGNWLKTPQDITAPDTPDNLWALAGNGIASLDWADNNEADLAGYNIYRSTNSGSGYTKLNGLPLTDSDYTDNTAANGIIYYYVVTAVDTIENESIKSTEACALPGSAANIILQENATGFCGVDGIIDTEHAGYTGSGFCDTENTAGSGIDWKINVPSDGTYTFIWRYAHGKTDDRTATLVINGTMVLSSIAFPPTGAFTTWSFVSVDVSLTAGTKDIRLEGITSNSLANIDYLQVVGINPAIASCN